jgi:hypothetical protein
VADLVGAKIESGTVRGLLGEGTTGAYRWCAWRMEGTEEPVLRIGCHERSVEWWESGAGVACAQENGGSAERLAALCVWVRALANAWTKGEPDAR